jgi:hypothetical protein
MDALFRSTLNEILDYENADDAQITADKETLYDAELLPLGVLYSFTQAGTDGFAIIIYDGGPTVTEVSLDAPSPFATEHTKVYIALQMYWYHDGAGYYDCVTGLKVADECIDEVKETAFSGSPQLQYDSETIYYIYRSENKYNVLTSIPIYNHAPLNGCAPIAGTNLVAYYDRLYPNLIPNYEPVNTFLGVWLFKGANSTTTALAETLHADMQTNVVQPGTTIPQFKNGLSIYAGRNGYSVGYTSVMRFGSLDYEQAKSVVTNNKALAIFMRGFRGTTFDSGNGNDHLMYEYATANHTVAGFGCLDVTYTLTNYQTRTDRYIHCSMGTGIHRNAYVNIATSQIDEALAIAIY